MREGGGGTKYFHIIEVSSISRASSQIISLALNGELLKHTKVHTKEITSAKKALFHDDDGVAPAAGPLY